MLLRASHTIPSRSLARARPQLSTLRAPSLCACPTAMAFLPERAACATARSLNALFMAIEAGQLAGCADHCSTAPAARRRRSRALARSHQRLRRATQVSGDIVTNAPRPRTRCRAIDLTKPPPARLRAPPARARAGCARAVRVQSLRPSRGPHQALSWTHPRCAQGQRDAAVPSLPKAVVLSLPNAVVALPKVVLTLLTTAVKTPLTKVAMPSLVAVVTPSLIRPFSVTARAGSGARAGMGAHHVPLGRLGHVPCRTGAHRTRNSVHLHDVVT